MLHRASLPRLYIRTYLVQNNPKTKHTLQYNPKDFHGAGKAVISNVKQGRLEEAYKLFVSSPDPAGASVIVPKLTSITMVSEVQAILQKKSYMNARVLSVLALAYLRLGNINNIEQLWKTSTTMEWTETTFSVFVKAACQAHNLSFLNDLTTQWPNLKMNSYQDAQNICIQIMQGFRKLNSIDGAIQAYRSLCKITTPDLSVFRCLLTACRKSGQPEKALFLWKDMNNFSITPDVTVFGSFTDICAEVGDAETALSLFNLVQLGRLTFTVEDYMLSQIIKALRNRLNDAMSVLEYMDQNGYHPHVPVYLLLLSGAATASACKMGENIHQRIIQHNIDQDPTIIGALIHMYGKCGHPQKAYQVFESARRYGNVTIKTWSAMINAFGQNGHGKEALVLFYEMIDAGVLPDGQAFLCAMHACSHGFMVEESLKLYHQLEDFNISPSVMHINSLLDCLSRSGHLQEAEDMVNKYANPNYISYMSILSGCRWYSDLERAERMFNKLTAIVPDDAATHVLMANIYNEAGKHDKADQVWSIMHHKGIKKIPGESYIEIDGKVHKFMASDKHHPMISQIHNKLDQLFTEMKQLGFHHDEGCMKHDIETDEAKVNHLCRHSEKLALGLGLILTPDGTSLSITKNLRMCRDCHNATMLISKLTSRQIKVRDANRFHTFEHGKCDCNNKW